MRIARAFVVMAGLVVALTSATVNAPTVLAAGDQFQDSAVTTYELQPSRGVIHVTMQVTMSNKKSSTSKSYKCTGYAYDPYYGFYSYTTTCTTRTSYYYIANSYWVEKDAKNLKVKASSGSISVKRGGVDGGWRKANLKFSGLYYGQSRKVTLQWDLPAGGPRSDAERRAGYAYTSFCAAGPGTDTGEVPIVVPEGFDLTVTGAMTSKTANAKTTYSSGKLKTAPWKFYSCVEGMNLTGGYTATTYPGASGTTTVDAWKGDTAWTDAATAAVTEDLPKLEAVLGPLPGGKDLTIREGLALNTAATWYDAASGVLTISEATVDRASVTESLASLWFPKEQFVTGWLKAGYMSWAERTAGVSDEACSKPGSKPGGGDLDLIVWAVPGEASPQASRDLYAYKKQVACYIVTQTAEAIGPERMATVLAALWDQGDAWSSADAPSERKTPVATWQDWLDLVTERGLIPAGADPRLAADLVATYGVVRDKDAVNAHEAARAGWHALQDQTDGRAPALILAALADWDDETAQTAIDAATKAWTTAGTVETTMPDVHTDGGPVQEAVVAAAAQADLDAAVAMADRQVAMASDVAAALVVLAAPRDAIQELGLVGTTLPDPAVAIEAVARVDAEAATDAANSIRSTIGGSRDAGVQRAALGGGGLVVVVLLIVGAVVISRRRRGPAVAVATAVPSAPAPPPVAPPDMPVAPPYVPAPPPYVPAPPPVAPAPPPVDAPAPPPAGPPAQPPTG